MKISIVILFSFHSFILFSQDFEIQGTYLNNGNTGNTRSIILHQDSTFEKYRSADWDRIKKVSLIKPNWYITNDLLVLKSGLYPQSKKVYKIVLYQKDVYLVPEKDYLKFIGLTLQENESPEKILKRNEKISSYLHKELK
jgi:hypothetical protein